MDVFPEHVTYPKNCKGLCRNSTPADFLNTFDLVLAAFVQIVARSPAMGTVAMDDVLLVCEMQRPEGKSFEFWWMVIASGQSGRHPATQTFVRLRPGHGVAFRALSEVAGCTLMVELDELVRQTERLPPPFDQVAAPPRFYDESSVAPELAHGHWCCLGLPDQHPDLQADLQGLAIELARGCRRCGHRL